MVTSPGSSSYFARKIIPGQGDKLKARIAFIGEAPGSDEEREGIPFCGPTGRILRNQLIVPNNIPPEICYFDNVCQEYRPTKWEADFSELSRFAVGLRRRLRELPNLSLIVPVGSKALQVLTLFETYEDKNGKQKPLSILNWRGSIKKSRLTGHKLLPIIHPSFYLHNPNEHRYLHVTIHDLARAFEESKNPLLQIPARDHRIIYQTDEILQTLSTLESIERWAFDVETQIRCIGFSPDPAISYTLVIQSIKHPNLHSPAGLAEIKNRLRRVFTHDHKIITQNGLFDMRDLESHYAINPRSWHIHSDTMAKHGLLYPELPHSLAFLTSIYTRTPFYKDEGRKFKPGRDPESQYFTYNGKDCCVTLEADDEMEKELSDLGQTSYYYHNLMPLLPILYDMYQRGVRINTSHLQEIKRQLRRSETISRIKLVRSIGFDPNPRSPIENEKFLQAIHCPPSRIVRSKKTNKVKCDEDFLQRLKIDLGHPAIQHALDLRTALYFQSNFTRLKLDSAERYHAIFKLGPKSGRLASSGDRGGPQLQNVPERGMANIRTIFIPPPRKAFVHSDLAQADARVFAYFAQISGLISIYESSDQDSHSQICAFLMGIPRSQIIKGGLNDDKRQITKMACHAFDYGMREKRLVTQCRAAGIEIDTKTATEWRDKYLKKFPEIEPHWLWIQQKLARDRTLEDLMGRKYIFLGEFDESMYREAYSRVPQGTVGGYISKAMVNFWLWANSRWEPEDPEKAFIWNQVHDSLEVECMEKDIEEVGLKIKDCFNIPLQAHGKTFTIPADFAVARASKGGSWGKMENITF